MPDDLRELTIVRFGPFTAEGCGRTAKEQYDDDLVAGRSSPRFGVSVFGDYRIKDETTDDVVRRICSDAPVNGKRVAVISRTELEDRGWSVHQDMPPPLHYLVYVGNLSEVPDVDSLSLLWNEYRINNPAWLGKRG